MDEAKLSEQMVRGEEAKRILNSPLFKEAFKALEASLIDDWKSTKADQKDVRENLYLMLDLLENFEQFFTIHVSNGNAAAAELLKKPSNIKRLNDGP